MDNTLNSYEYLKRISDTYKNEKSLTSMLKSYRCISEDFGKQLNEKKHLFNYKSYNYDECSQNEQQDFFNNQLQFIECLVTNSIYDKTGTIWNWNDIYKLLHDSTYAQVEKINRRVVYATASNNRPIGDVAFQIWNGLQIIDLDIKNAELATILKPLLFKELKKFNWFLGVCKSASGKGLHVWTKITPISIEFKNRKIEFLCNFRHKYSYVYVVLDKYAKQYNYSKENIYQFMDMAMCKPQQGIFISSDNALMNTNFIDTRLDVNFEGAFDCGVSSVDWIAHPDLKQIFSKLEWFNNDHFDKENNVEIKDIANLQERDINRAKGPKHYKHAQRWQLANTLTSIFGEEKAFSILCQICKNTESRELRGDIKTASLHNKPISLWAINELNKEHGFKLEIKNNDTFKEEIAELDMQHQEIANGTVDPTRILNDNTTHTLLHLKANQFLSDIKDEIIANLDHVTLLEAGAGYGKTEMIKSLKAKTLLILPFTSTIKAKVEASSVTKDWLYYYGNKRPQTADLMGSHNMSMTIDKFSRLNIYELDASEFEYIVIDESHLLFTSSYRDVMCPCIQRLANCKAKVIMMTGTPTGEMLFFPNIKHIRVKKEDTRIKTCTVNLVNSSTEQFVEMAREMSNDIQNGIKILFPTNSGATYFEEITGIVQEFLNEAHFPRELKKFYYKKSNYGDESMDEININKSVGDNDIVCCSTYLSVGVDICDRNKFSIYFDQTWIPQDVEQFANRIRNNDLYIKIFLPMNDNSGVPITYKYIKPLDLGFDKRDLLFAHDLVKTCNDMLERNAEESKYSPFILSLISANKYLKYDENDCRYYIDETTYKLKVFEDRYSEYTKQLYIMLEGLKYYGYQTEIIESNKIIDPLRKEKVEEFIKACKHRRYNEVTIQTQRFLDNINDGNIDIYRELLKGNYEIFKDAKYKEVREQNTIYAESIEILEKNTPIVLSLYKYYDCDTIREIYDYCTEKKTNKINFSKLERIRQFANIESAIKKKRLDFPVYLFFNDCRKWAKTNSTTTKTDIDNFLASWAAKYCNSVTDVVVEDTMYLESIYELVQSLWKVVIIQARPKNGNVVIAPFELLWETKQQLQDIYGNMNTQTFFIEQLLGEMKPEEIVEEKEEILPELPHTAKMTLEQVEPTLKDVVHDNYDYAVYSNIDGSNDRFLRKQENTNQLRDTLFDKPDEETINDVVQKKDMQLDLFESTDEKLPF